MQTLVKQLELLLLKLLQEEIDLLEWLLLGLLLEEPQAEEENELLPQNLLLQLLEQLLLELLLLQLLLLVNWPLGRFSMCRNILMVLSSLLETTLPSGLETSGQRAYLYNWLTRRIFILGMFGQYSAF